MGGNVHGKVAQTSQKYHDDFMANVGLAARGKECFQYCCLDFPEWGVAGGLKGSE